VKIAVIGMGKIGLPLATQFASKGHHVTGVDVNQKTVDLINSGIEPFPGEAHLQEKMSELVPSGLLRATSDYSEAIPDADAIVIVVPLFVDKDAVPDFGWMDQATTSLAANLTPGTLVAYETTLPVGTTRTRWKPMLEEGSGLVEGKDFHLVFSPERVLTGRVFADLRKYPKLVGGLSPEGAAVAVDFYKQVLDFDERPDLERGNGVWDLGSAEASEMAKLAETTYRDVNIGLANQFAVFAQKSGIDIYQVISASNSQPFSHIHQPGIAVGGHCIPVYPRLYLWNDPDATVVRAARAANADMPNYAVGLLNASLGGLKGKTVVILGAAYRGGVKETAFSGVFGTNEALLAAGATVLVHDPLYTDEELNRLGFTAYHFGTPADGVVIQADHSEYKSVTSEDVPGVAAIVDGRRVSNQDSWPGAIYSAIGIPQ
jgi:nucleotide sugar dehydrogenase